MIDPRDELLILFGIPGGSEPTGVLYWEETDTAGEDPDPPTPRSGWSPTRARHIPPVTWPGGNGRTKAAPWRKNINLARRCGR